MVDTGDGDHRPLDKASDEKGPPIRQSDSVQAIILPDSELRSRPLEAHTKHKAFEQTVGKPKVVLDGNTFINFSDPRKGMWATS